ncbi:MAG TPA: threonine/serine dehydratase [Candidatus Limnocylindrales bacterium]|nr:threonine/serine dehydratase [Candidatus Limnocylindrales bacterium]
MLGLQDIQQAQKNIASYAKLTPLMPSKFLSDLCNAKVFLKLENQQLTGSFKIRGVINKLLSLSAEEKARGVITASAGNHGEAVAFGAKKLGFQAKIVVPTHAPQIKVDGIRHFGAELILHGETYDQAEKKAKELAAQEGKLYISPYNDERIVAGHGTVGLEILKELPVVDVVIVPVGGGGLIGGIAIAVKSQKPTVKVIGVQSAASPVMYESLKAGKIVPPHRHERYTIAEGLVGAVEKGSITFDIAQKHVDYVTLAREESIRRAVYLLWKNEKQVVEGSGAAGVALLLENRDVFTGQTVVVVISGGNIDPYLFEGIVAAEE